MPSKPVLFTSERELERAESMLAIYNAYDGPKKFVKAPGVCPKPEIESGEYDLMIVDEFPWRSPGKLIYIPHGLDGCKTDGLDVPIPYHTRENGMLMDRYVSSSTYTAPIYARCSGIPEQHAAPLGNPRTDHYIGKKKGDGKTELARKRSYLYAPTYRRWCETPLPYVDLQWIDKSLHDDELFVVKAHDATGAINIGRYEHIIEITPEISSEPYLYDCDVLITDYSSIMLDALLLGKPVVLFEKCPGYTMTRGMYRKYPYQYNSRYARNEYELLTEARNALSLNPVERDLLEFSANMCDGHACERICKLIHELNESR